MKSKILSILLLTAFLLLALCACSTKTTEPELVAEPSFDLPGGSYYETGCCWRRQGHRGQIGRASCRERV